MKRPKRPGVAGEGRPKKTLPGRHKVIIQARFLRSADNEGYQAEGSETWTVHNVRAEHRKDIILRARRETERFGATREEAELEGG